MANPVRYNTEADPNSLRIGNLNIGTNNVPKGPTSSTGFFSGINPPANGYTIYLNKASNGPSILTPSSDAQLITMTNQIAGASYTTINQCFLYYGGQNDKKVMHNPITPMTTDGLVYSSNAGILPSYPRSGIDLYDLSGVAEPSILFNGPSFDENAGALVFDGVDDSVSTGITTQLDDFSVVVVFKNNNSVAWGRLVDKSYSTGFFISSYFATFGNGYVGAGIIEPSSPHGQALPYDQNKYNYFVVTRSGTTHTIYLNGSGTSSSKVGSSANISSTAMAIGSWFDGRGSQIYTGEISQVSLYNKALTTSEIDQNYYQAPIVTNGLTFAVDAGNLVSFNPGETTAYNLAGDNNMSLLNGLGWGNSSNGYFSSDGVNDGLHASDSSNLDLNNFTLEGWVWWNQHKNYGSLLVKGPGGSGNVFNYCFFFYSGNIVVGFGNGGAFYNVSIAAPPTDTWHHIVGTYDGATLKFYLNGTLANSSGVSETPYQNNNDLQVIQTNYPIDGRVGAARVYNRALSADEVQQNYQANINRFN